MKWFFCFWIQPPIKLPSCIPKLLPSIRWTDMVRKPWDRGFLGLMLTYLGREKNWTEWKIRTTFRRVEESLLLYIMNSYLLFPPFVVVQWAINTYFFLTKCVFVTQDPQAFMLEWNDKCISKSSSEKNMNNALYHRSFGSSLSVNSKFKYWRFRLQNKKIQMGTCKGDSSSLFS